MGALSEAVPVIPDQTSCSESFTTGLFLFLIRHHYFDAIVTVDSSTLKRNLGLN